MANKLLNTKTVKVLTVYVQQTTAGERVYLIFKVKPTTELWMLNVCVDDIIRIFTPW